MKGNTEYDKENEFLMLGIQKFVIVGFFVVLAIEFVQSFVPEEYLKPKNQNN